MAMYAVTPFLVLFLDALTRRVSFVSRDLARIALLAVLVCLSNRFLTTGVFRFPGLGEHQVFRIWQYMIGMAFG